jgi:hypothetical protein
MLKCPKIKMFGFYFKINKNKERLKTLPGSYMPIISQVEKLTISVTKQVRQSINTSPNIFFL